MAVGPHWLAGPVMYSSSWIMLTHGRKYTRFSFDFAAMGSDLNFRRYRLNYMVDSRTFAVTTGAASDDEQRNSDRLAALYRPIAVLRSDLPKGKIEVALQAMLTDAERAHLLSVSIAQADLFNR